MIIYIIRNVLTGKSYVGQMIQKLEQRWREHKSKAESGCLFALHSAIRKYGIENFEISILAEAHTLTELNALEEYHIKVQNTLAPNGYNIHTGGRNHETSLETREKQRIAKLGRKLSFETREKMRIAKLGRSQSAESRAKRSQTLKGRIPSPETLRRAHSPEIRAKAAATLIKRRGTLQFQFS